MSKSNGSSAERSLEMARRPGKFVNVNTRHEGRGKEDVQLCADISVRGFHIDEAELNHFLGAKAWNALFVSANGKGKPAEPMFRNVDPIHVWDEFEGCDVSISLGLSESAIEFEDAFVSKIELEPQVGGLTLMKFLVSVEVEDTDDVARLLEVMGDECNISVVVGGKFVPKDKKAQQKLDLGPAPDAKPDEKGEGATAGAVH